MSEIGIPGNPGEEIAELVRAIRGVHGVYGARTALRGAATRVLGSRAEPSPVVVRVSAEEVAVAVEIAVSASSTAPETARSVASAVSAWCASSYPGRAARVDVRVAYIE